MQQALSFFFEKLLGQEGWMVERGKKNEPSFHLSEPIILVKLWQIL